MAQIDHKLQKWNRWMKEIHDDIQALVIAEKIFQSMWTVIKTNPKIQKQKTFCWYLESTYASYAFMGVRRQVKEDKKKNSISFARLLREIADNAAKISRQFYKDLRKGLSSEKWADKEFDRFCKNPGDSHISPHMVEADLVKLKATGKSCGDFADRVLAHCDPRGPTAIPEIKEADRAIETLHKLYLKYHQMLHAQAILNLHPIYQYYWQEIFDYPWRLPAEKSE